MKKFFVSIISLVLTIPFFLSNSISVKADYDYQTYSVESYEILAYEYWYRLGYTSLETLSVSQVIAIPDFRTDYGAQNYSYQCRLSGTTYNCAAYSPDGTYMGTYDWSITRSPDITIPNITVHGKEVPWMTGTYIHDTSHVSNNRDIFLPANGVTYISFVSTKNAYISSGVGDSDASNNQFMQVWSRDGVTNKITVDRILNSEITGVYNNTFRLTNNDASRHWVTINFVNFDSSTKIVPIYIGSGNDVPDNVKQSLGIPTKTESSLSDINSKIDTIQSSVQQSVLAQQRANSLSEYGNTNTQSSTTNLTQSNSELSGSVSQINSIETTYNDDLNAALDDIDISTDLVQHTGFTNAALWVSAQFNRLVIGTPFELVMTFSLITGLALVLIGKMRG